MNKLLKKFGIIIFIFTNLSLTSVSKSAECKWDNKSDALCITIKPIPNTSQISTSNVNRYIISAKEIKDSRALDINDVIEMIPGIHLTQSGPMGQQTSVFTRGTNSNHTLVLLNGIPINDQSTTQGLHDFGVDFIQSIEQVEVYLGPNGAHFGPSAIGGAINFITNIDYTNSINVSSLNMKNKIIDTNYTFTTDSGWIFNLKGGLVNSNTNSARKGGVENDEIKNLNGNLNVEKWINDKTKFSAVVFGRQTKSEYDSSPSVEEEYTGDNIMYATQFSLDRKEENIEDILKFHLNKYDRKYREAGTLDEYESNAFALRGERKIKLSDKLSLGFGLEHKYDWGEFINRGSSYSSSTKGNVYDNSAFTNIGFKPFNNTVASIYSRLDDHKTTGKHKAHKINITHNIFNNLKVGATHSTGFRNPSLYELYGTDSSGYSGNKELNPEKAKTKEIFGEYNISNNLKISLTGFNTSIYDHVEYKNNKYVNDTSQTDLNQSGVETNISWTGKGQSLSFFGTSLSSKKTNGVDQLRRPDKTYGFLYNKKIDSDTIGPFQFNLKYQHYGKHWDTHSTNWSTVLMDSTDILNFSLSKKIGNYNWFLKMSNLLDESYQRPHGYEQEERQFRIGLTRNY